MIGLRLLSKTIATAKLTGFEKAPAKNGNDGFVVYDPKFIKSLPVVDKTTDDLKVAAEEKVAIRFRPEGVVVARQSWIDLV